MRRFEINPGWGWFLLVTGLLALLTNFDVLSGWSAVLWGVFFALGSVFFLTMALRPSGEWWAFIPGGVLFGLMLATLSNGAGWGGPAFLASIGAGFLLIAVRHPESWWAVIPGGAVLSVALAAAVPGQAGGTFMFLGMAATFFVLGLVRPARAHGMTHRWAWYPAAGLLALAVLSGGWFSGAWGTLWPLALIVLGSVLLFAPRRGRH
jgi:hypothetical protein